MKHESRGHALAAVKAACNLIPFVGGAIASLIGDYIPVSTQRSVEITMELLAEKLKTLEGRIDVDAVNVVRSQREEKLRAAANLLANLLLKTSDPAKVSYEELDHFVRCLDALSIGAISVLGAARAIAISAPMGGQGHFHFDQLRDAFPSYDVSLTMSLVSELRGLNLLHVQEAGIKVPDYGNYLLDLTPIGLRFVERFIEGSF